MMDLLALALASFFVGLAPGLCYCLFVLIREHFRNKKHRQQMLAEWDSFVADLDRRYPL
jgi:hypothetical protein